MSGAKYLIWKQNKVTRVWVGIADNRQIVAIERRKYGVYLIRSNGSAEKCDSIGHAKEYANELARLWGYPPIKQAKGTNNV